MFLMVDVFDGWCFWCIYARNKCVLIGILSCVFEVLRICVEMLLESYQRASLDMQATLRPLRWYHETTGGHKCLSTLESMWRLAIYAIEPSYSTIDPLENSIPLRLQKSDGIWSVLTLLLNYQTPMAIMWSWMSSTAWANECTSLLLTQLSTLKVPLDCILGRSGSTIDYPKQFCQMEALSSPLSLLVSFIDCYKLSSWHQLHTTHRLMVRLSMSTRNLRDTLNLHKPM
jgi:hypothetical protein